MTGQDTRKQWEAAASGWAKWEDTIAQWMEPATQAMLKMAGIREGSRVLDMACGAGSQTLVAARLVGKRGHLVATDISITMLEFLRKNAEAEKLDNITTMPGAAEDIEVPNGSFDAVICRLGLMLFADPSKAVGRALSALKTGGHLSAVVFTGPESNHFMTKTMQVLLHHAGKDFPPAGSPGIFSLGQPGAAETLLASGGFLKIEQQKIGLTLNLSTSAMALEMMKDAFGAYRAIISDCPAHIQAAAWSEMAEVLKTFETKSGFEANSEVLVIGASK